MTARNVFPDGESRAARQARIAAADRRWSAGGVTSRRARARAVRHGLGAPRRLRHRRRAGRRAVRGAAGDRACRHAGPGAPVSADRGVVRTRRSRGRHCAAVGIHPRRIAASRRCDAACGARAGARAGPRGPVLSGRRSSRGERAPRRRADGGKRAAERDRAMRRRSRCIRCRGCRSLARRRRRSPRWPGAIASSWGSISTRRARG